MIDVTTVRVGADNYSYILPCGKGLCLVVDPGSAGPVMAVLEARRLKPSHILCTHGHADHTAGVAELTRRYESATIGPQTPLADDHLAAGGLSVRRIATPGHTADSVCYHVTEAAGGPACLFTGDTLFIAGCGRVFGTDMQTMYDSLRKLAALPEETLVYPGHDYTEQNYRFALLVEPDNPHVRGALEAIHGHPCEAPDVPSTLGREKLTNPFLRAADVATFADRRRRKDRF